MYLCTKNVGKDVMGMKIAKVVFKAGDKCVFTNYRPIFYYRNLKKSGKTM